MSNLRPAMTQEEIIQQVREVGERNSASKPATVFVVTGDVMDYDETSWVENVYDSLDQIPEELAQATFLQWRGKGRYRKQTYTVDEWATDGSGRVRQWVWDGEWHSSQYLEEYPYNEGWDPPLEWDTK